MTAQLRACSVVGAASRCRQCRCLGAAAGGARGQPGEQRSRRPPCRGRGRAGRAVWQDGAYEPAGSAGAGRPEGEGALHFIHLSWFLASGKYFLGQELLDPGLGRERGGGKGAEGGCSILPRGAPAPFPVESAHLLPSAAPPCRARPRCRSAWSRTTWSSCLMPSAQPWRRWRRR